MKIKTITCHAAHNYGAVLQSYALQTYLESCGNEVEIIDYVPDYMSEVASIFYVGDKKYKTSFILKMIYISLVFPTKLKRILAFNKFEKKYLKLTLKQYKTYNELLNEDFDADAYFCGSDQIWNFKLPNGHDKSYYLDFIKDKKLKHSYAASIANHNLNEEDLEKLKIQTRDLSNISVREKEAVKILNELGKQDVEYVLDPVFLLDKSKWIDLCAPPVESKYVLIYRMGDDHSLYEAAKNIAREKGLKIVEIGYSARTNKGVDKTYRGVSPNTFLSLIRYADSIVSNSFHAVAFSIIFEKNIVPFAIANTNSRMLNLLKACGMEKRLQLDINNIQTTTICYEEVNRILATEINNSKKYIEKCLMDSKRYILEGAENE